MEDIENIKKQLFDAIFKRQDRNEVEQILSKYPNLVDEHIEYWDFGDEEDHRNDGRTPLLSAFAFADMEMCKMLLKKFNADPNKGNYNERTILFRISSKTDANSMILADLLLEKGADVNKPTYTGKTPLMLAAQYGNLEMVQKLLDHGADANAKDEDNTNALSWMGYYRGEKNEKLIDEIVRLLIEAGADPHNVDDFEHTPLSMAKEYDEPLVEKALLKYMNADKAP